MVSMYNLRGIHYIFRILKAQASNKFRSSRSHLQTYDGLDQNLNYNIIENHRFIMKTHNEFFRKKSVPFV